MPEVTSQAPFKHVFGPVPSRRLGRSLGVDLVPFKTCTYDCVYCQLGRTTNQTTVRKEYVPLDDVLDEVRRRLAADASPDYITLSGSGEPTLYSRLDELIAGLKSISRVPVAVLTNGSLLWQREVQEAVSRANLVVPSLDAGDPWLFDYVNRPHQDISFDTMAEGLVKFRERFRTPMWLEVFLLNEVTSGEAEVRKIAQWVKRIAPDRVQLNTVARPPAEKDVSAVPRNVLERLALLFEPRAEVIADFSHSESSFSSAVSQQEVLALLSRRPCTVKDVADGLGIHFAEALKRLESLTADGKIKAGFTGGLSFYAVRQLAEDKH